MNTFARIESVCTFICRCYLCALLIFIILALAGVWFLKDSCRIAAKLSHLAFVTKRKGNGWYELVSYISSEAAIIYIFWRLCHDCAPRFFEITIVNHVYSFTTRKKEIYFLLQGLFRTSIYNYKKAGSPIKSGPSPTRVYERFRYKNAKVQFKPHANSNKTSGNFWNVSFLRALFRKTVLVYRSLLVTWLVLVFC